MDKRKEVKLRPREEALHKKWAGKAENRPVNSQQHSFDSLERQDEFIQALLTTREEKEIYRRYREEWYRRGKECDPKDAPLAVCCELVSTCNLNCPMCYSITEEFQASVVGAQRQMPWKLAKAIIDECAALNVPSMLFSWRGEPTLYRSKDESAKLITLPDVLAYARKKGILEITLLSNGHMMDHKMARALIEAEPSWISISVDGLKENYDKIRTPVNMRNKGYESFKKVTDNIRQLVALRDKTSKKRPQIRTNTIYPPIAEDPMGYYEYMKSLGVGWVTINEILDFRGENLPDDTVIKDWSCQYPFQRLTVSANGSILPCTGAHNEEIEVLLGRYPGSRPKEVTKDGKTEIIELEEMTLKKAWHCEKLEKIRMLHKANRRCEIRACRNCRHGAVKHGVEWIPEDWDMEVMEWKGREWKE